MSFFITDGTYPIIRFKTFWTYISSTFTAYIYGWISSADFACLSHEDIPP